MLFEKRSGKAVMILETNMVFNSIQSCADYLNANVNWIKKILDSNDPHKTCYGYHIVRVGEPLPNYNLNKKDYRGRPGVSVMIVETGEQFESVTDCARYINGSTGKICDVINGHLDSYLGMHFIRNDI